MKRKIREDLVKIATDILTSREDRELTELYHISKELYEKLAVLKFVDEKLNDLQIDVSKTVVAQRFETIANQVMHGNKSVPENNPHEEDIITPGMHTIRDMVSEMPKEVDKYGIDDFLSNSLMKNDKEILENQNLPMPAVSTKTPKSLNDVLTKTLQIGLNDKLAFIKHLFGNNPDAYQKTLIELNQINTLERSIAFINNMIKPEYNQWVGKEEYETRFIELIERKFS